MTWYLGLRNNETLLECDSLMRKSMNCLIKLSWSTLVKRTSRKKDTKWNFF